MTIEAARASVTWHDEAGLAPHDELWIGSGAGCWITEDSGRRLFDAGSGHSCVNLGYAHPELIAQAADSYRRLAYCSPEHHCEASEALAVTLDARLGGGYRIRYATTGGGANELAIEIARRYWRHLGRGTKRKVIAFDRSYHGSTGAASYASGPGILQSHLADRSAEFVHLPGARDPVTGVSHAIEQIRAAVEHCLAADPEGFAALIVEPVAFAGGVVIPPPGKLRMLAKLAATHELLLIVDEVITGFGRSGRFFAFQHEDVRPDIVTVGKGITSAYFPLAATAVSEPIFETFKVAGQEMRKLVTMAGHPVGCDIAAKVIEIMDRDDLVSRVGRNADLHLSRLRELDGVAGLRQVRGVGQMWGLEFGGTPEQGAARADAVARHCHAAGVLVLQAHNMVRINPPLVATGDELGFLVDTLREAVRATS